MIKLFFYTNKKPIQKFKCLDNEKSFHRFSSFLKGFHWSKSNNFVLEGESLTLSNSYVTNQSWNSALNLLLTEFTVSCFSIPPLHNLIQSSKSVKLFHSSNIDNNICYKCTSHQEIKYARFHSNNFVYLGFFIKIEFDNIG